MEHQPDFVVFTGDLTHTTDDPKVRRTRLAEFRDIASGLKVKDVCFMPGKYEFICDVFCGEGHEDMTGMITVVE